MADPNRGCGGWRGALDRELVNERVESHVAVSVRRPERECGRALDARRRVEPL